MASVMIRKRKNYKKFNKSVLMFDNLTTFSHAPTNSKISKSFYKTVTYFTLHLLSDWHVSNSSPLAYLRERTCEFDIGAFLHCNDSNS